MYACEYICVYLGRSVGQYVHTHVCTMDVRKQVDYVCMYVNMYVCGMCVRSTYVNRSIDQYVCSICISRQTSMSVCLYVNIRVCNMCVCRMYRCVIRQISIHVCQCVCMYKVNRKVSMCAHIRVYTLQYGCRMFVCAYVNMYVCGMCVCNTSVGRLVYMYGVCIYTVCV